jgi:IS30 family transposase
MARKGRPGLSPEKKAEVWERWRRGESFSEIGRAVDKAPGSIYGVLQLYGGITPRERKRSRLALALTEREEISRGIASNLSMREIARIIGRSPSTVSREINRNGGLSQYRAVKADEHAWDRASRPKICKLSKCHKLCRIVEEKLSFQWSPEQISGWLKREYPANLSMQVSHETIYRTLFLQTRDALKKDLLKNLRTGRKMRQSKQFNTKGVPRGQIIDGVSIHERPKDIKDRFIPGHWEGDLVSGSKNTHIATVVERQSRYTIIAKLDGKDTVSVTRALCRQMTDLPEVQRKTITWDRGMELAFHKKFTLATDIQVYFCDPCSPWQRGTNENTNGLLRQYFPKKTDLSIYSQKELDYVALRLNQRPRKTLGYSTPVETFWSSVALTD